MRPSLGVLATSLASACLACVPRTEELDPRGAAGVRLEPSRASQGEPFDTHDGFRLRFERLALMGSAQATSIKEGFGNTTPPYVWSGASAAESWVPSLPEGTYTVRFELQGIYLWWHDRGFENVAGPGLSVAAWPGQPIAPEDLARFAAPPDNQPVYDDAPGNLASEGPRVLLAVRAERAGEVFTLDLALTQPLYSFADFTDRDPVALAEVVVRANALALAAEPVAAERIFETSGFAVYAAADADHDGRITAAELRATIREMDEDEEGSCDPSGVVHVFPPEDFDSQWYVPPCPTLLDQLAVDAVEILDRSRRR